MNNFLENEEKILFNTRLAHILKVLNPMRSLSFTTTKFVKNLTVS